MTDCYDVDWQSKPHTVMAIFRDIIAQSGRHVPDEDISKLVFAVPHAMWADNGLSGASKPLNVRLVYSDDYTAIISRERSEKLDALIAEWDHNLDQKVTHWESFSPDGNKRLCGREQGRFAKTIGTVTCPHCIREILLRTEFVEAH